MIDIFPFKQSDGSKCGPAVIKMVLNYYGIDATEDRICELTHHTYELGCTNKQMQEALEFYGISSIIETDCTIEDVEYWHKFHIPVIVDWFSPGFDTTPEDMPNGHASIIVGVDDTKIHLLDPENGKIRPILKEEFMRVWFDWETDPYLKEETPIIRRLMIIPFPKKIEDSI